MILAPVLAAAVTAGLLPARARAPSPPPAPPPPVITQWSVRETIIMRIPVRPEPAPAQWEEKSGRRCMEVETIARASMVSSEALDLTLRSGERWRLKFSEQCPAIGFYRGFYLRPPDDGKICAGRDTVHLRSGGECEIETFKRLKPAND